MGRHLPRMQLPLLTRKSIRKWRDRGFMCREAVLDRIVLRQGKRILLWPWQEIEPQVRFSLRFHRHEPVFAPIPAGGGNYDVIVPLSVDTLIASAGDEELNRRNPLPIPRPDVVRLLDDKSACNARLRELGFGRHVPGAPQAGDYPYLLKLSRDAFARNIHLITGPTDEERHRELLADPAYFRQVCIEDRWEYTTHILHYGGRTRRALTMGFEMHSAHAIKGRDPHYFHRRCRNRHIPLFEAMLNGLGFEGLCCFNYKERDGVPLLFEINPRFGFSLGAFFGVFVRSFDWSRSR
jgi:hypothetical protein